MHILTHIHTAIVHDQRHDTMEHPFLLKWHFAIGKKSGEDEKIGKL